MLEQFHFLPGSHNVQCVALGVTENKSSAGREQLRQVRIIKQLLNELELYDPALLEKPRLVVANKMDEAVAEKNLKQFKKKIRKVSLLPISAAFDQGIEKFKKTIREAVRKASAG